jgi:Zn-dependent peptidase ImmA (M78 family)/formiminotetrahydrofolate cyclodeaminase
LLKTVIGLSKDRESYKNARAELISIEISITEEIEPALWKAFEDDSIQFDKVIKARRARDDAKEPGEHRLNARKALSALHSATDILLIIAEKCLLLAEKAAFVFDKGFQDARGDSGVAISSALSGATGVISIIYLNLGKFRGDSRSITLISRTEKLEKRADLLNIEFQSKVFKLKGTADDSNINFRLDIDIIRSKKRIDSRYSKSDIETIARNLQVELWENQNEIWSDESFKLSEGNFGKSIKILNPEIAIRNLGYDFVRKDFLGRFTDDNGAITAEIAGYINKQEQLVEISEKFSPVAQRFTAAHELGHAVLHKANKQFRDRSLDGSEVRPRIKSEEADKIESEADTFAACFLMPKLIMLRVFKEIFSLNKFAVSNETAVLVGFRNAEDLLEKCPTMRSLSRHLSQTVTVSGRSVAKSIAESFDVSIETMAIRIEELRLIDRNGYQFKSRN